MSEIIRLPIPSDKLAANARCSRFTKAAITKRHRAVAAMFAFQQIDKHPMASYKLVFFWPDKIRRDKRNAAERCKAFEDGIADYLGQDDSEWEFSGVEFGVVDKENPRVEFHFTTIKEATEQVDELTELRKDKARLAFLLKDKWVNIEYCSVEIYARDAIDAAMEDANNEN
tara:strand:- start:62 stop:574 length:513 start_codon:yes stop_codon:yes gene_type:complete